MKKKSVVFLGLLGASGINCLAADASTQRMMAVDPPTTQVGADTPRFATTDHSIQANLEAALANSKIIAAKLGKKDQRRLAKAEFHAQTANTLLSKIKKKQ